MHKLSAIVMGSRVNYAALSELARKRLMAVSEVTDLTPQQVVDVLTDLRHNLQRYQLTVDEIVAVLTGERKKNDAPRAPGRKRRYSKEVEAALQRTFETRRVSPMPARYAAQWDRIQKNRKEGKNG